MNTTSSRRKFIKVSLVVLGGITVSPLLPSMKNNRLFANPMDITFDPPMPDATIPAGMVGDPNKNVGWMHTYIVTTDPGRQPVLSFSGHSSNINPLYNMQQIQPGEYRVDVTLSTGSDITTENLQITIDDEPVGIREETNSNNVVPEKPVLLNNYPQPFNPSTTIDYILPEAMQVTLIIYNTQGELVNNLFSGYKTKGSHSVVWNGDDANRKDVPSGVYLLQLRTRGYQKTIKMIKMK